MTVQQPDAFDAEEVAALRRAAALKRSEGAAELADIMERYATHGLPRVEDCIPWEEARDARLTQLGVDVSTPRVA